MRAAITVLMPLVLYAQVGVNRLQYIDPYDRPMTSYAQWSATIAKEPFTIGNAYRSFVDGARQPLVDVVVFAPLLSGIQDSLSIYVADLEAEGYVVRVDTVRGWNAAGLRAHLAALADSELVGAVLIGNVPFAWYEMESSEGREEFPIDLYLMDLDGSWVDSDANYLFDTHTGDRAPEIWVGRIYAASMTWGNEVMIINNYLSKLHRYRTGGYGMPQKALAYVDDDWYSFNNCGLTQLYDTVVVVRGYNTTVAADFRNRLDDAYEWVHICSHSSPWATTFKNSSGYAGTVFNFELWFADPTFLFVNLFQCSGTRFFEENFIGGCYVFGTENGLLAVGSAKVGGMLDPEDFYAPMDDGISIGAAFQEWFTEVGITDESWFYGMCLVGDPALKPKQSGTMYTGPRRSFIDPAQSLAWSPPEPVGAHAESDGYVTACTDAAGRVWAAWVTGRSTINGRTEICATYFQNGAWQGAHIVDAYEYWDFAPALCRDAQGNAALAWSRAYGRNYDVYLSTYTGGSWGTPFRVSSRATDDMWPAITADGDGRTWVTMERWYHLNGDIYCRYHDSASWYPIFAVTVDSANDYRPKMATDSTGRAWTVYTTERYEDNRNIYVKNYNSSSGHWENLRRITSNAAQDQDPVIGVDGSGMVWVVWTSWRNGNPDLYGSCYDGVNWSSNEPVTDDPGRDENAALVTDRDGNIWCVWQSDRSGDPEIYVQFYRGGQWEGLTNVSANTARDVLPAATLDDSGYVWVLWQSNRTGNWDIYASRLFADVVPPAVSVVTPNGGEVWNIGDAETISWVASDNDRVDTISIHYSTDNGANWITLATGEPNDSAFSWTIPPTPSTQCRVRVVAYDVYPNSAEDVSDAVFTIRDTISPQVTLYHPNGGEIFMVGDPDTVRWSASDNIAVDSIVMELSDDDGATWSFIACPDPAESSYAWTIPARHSTECRVRMRIFDQGLNTGADVSDSVFAIVDAEPPAVAVLVPNGGEIWYWNEQHDIRWQATDNAGVDSCLVELSLDGGLTFPLVLATIAGQDSVYTWTIPETTCYVCVVRVTAYDIAGALGQDQSDTVFTIGAFGVEELLGIPLDFALTMVSPNPFFDDIRLRLALPVGGAARIALYDVDGRCVATLLDGHVPAGYHAVLGRTDRLASGVYFLHARAGQWEQGLKLVKFR